MDADTDVGERRLELDRGGHAERAEHDHGRHHVRHDVADAGSAAPDAGRAARRARSHVRAGSSPASRRRDQVGAEADADDDADRQHARLRHREDAVASSRIGKLSRTSARRINGFSIQPAEESGDAAERETDGSADETAPTPTASESEPRTAGERARRDRADRCRGGTAPLGGLGLPASVRPLGSCSVGLRTARSAARTAPHSTGARRRQPHHREPVVTKLIPSRPPVAALDPLHGTVAAHDWIGHHRALPNRYGAQRAGPLGGAPQRRQRPLQTRWKPHAGPFGRLGDGAPPIGLRENCRGAPGAEAPPPTAAVLS